MKFFITFALFVAAAAAIPVDTYLSPSKEATIENYIFNNIGVDGYNYEYKTSDGKSASEQAVVKNIGTNNEGLEVTGRYSYIGKDGILYEVTYTANDKGFQPHGAHLPQGLVNNY